MKSNLTILFTSAGRRTHLIETFRSDAKRLGVSLCVIAADSSPRLSAACALADDRVSVPPCRHVDYVPVLRALCLERCIDMVIPTIDTELITLAGAKASFADIDVRVVVSSPDALRVARDKWLTATTLGFHAVPVPLTIPLGEALAVPNQLQGPIILKPRAGSNSQGLRRIASLMDAALHELSAESYVAQQLCEGPEYTVNCFVSHAGKLITAVPHQRIEVRGGEVSKALTERRQDILELAPAIASAMPGLEGPFCFQAIATDDGPKVIEVNARFGGGYPVAHEAGARFGQWLMEEHLGVTSSASDEWESNLLMLRHDAAVFTHGFTA